MGKLNKQSSGVGKYLKYHKEKSTGGSLPDIHQQTHGGEYPQICPSCGSNVVEVNCVNACTKCDFWEYSSS